MLASDGQRGGLSGLVAKFHQSGLGDVASSWIGTGQNMPISADQLTPKGQLPEASASGLGDLGALLGRFK